MVKKIQNVFKIVVDILTFLVFLLLILTIFSKFKMVVSDKDYFDMFGYSLFSVATGSMEPTIKQNDIIVVHKQNNYKVDDIVTFKSERAYVTHRIVTKRGNTIVTKGDANNTKDVAIEKKDIIGKVVKILPNFNVI